MKLKTAIYTNRGRLVLRHLNYLMNWTIYDSRPAAVGKLFQKIDFSRVGLLGHSRFDLDRCVIVSDECEQRNLFF